MDDFGSRLKHAREEKGISLSAIADQTKIGVGVLEALERSDYRRLPGGIYGRSLVRSYAAIIGLDPEATVQDYLAHLTQAERDAQRNARRPEITPDDRAFLERQQRAIRTFRIALVLAVVVGVTAGVIVWMMRSDGEPVAQESTPPSAPPSTPAPGPDQGAAAPATGTAPETAGLRLDFELTAECWVKIAIDDKPAVEKMMAAGERQRIVAEREIYVSVGNAGAFVWSLNGQRAKPLGPLGTARQARVTLENFKTFLE